MARYSEYPAFQERLRALEEERRTQKQALLATAEAHLQSGDALQFDQEAWSATFDQIDATIEQQILEAHAHYQVPILQAWDQALQTTGKARYHDEYSLPGQHMQAVMRREGNTIVLEYTVTTTFPNTHYPLERIPSYLLWRSINQSSWETLTEDGSPTKGVTGTQENIVEATPERSISLS